MLNIHRHRALFYYLKTIISQSKSPNTKPYSLLQHFCTNTTSDSRSFVVSYLITNFVFSPEFASKASSAYRIGFKTSKNPDSVLSFFQNRGFSNFQIHDLIQKAPWLLSSNPDKRLLPKFEFFLSKGISNSDIVKLVSKNPVVLRPSLEKQIIPSYELVYRFLQSDKETCNCVIHCPTLYGDSRVEHNIRMLIENGVTETNIARLFRRRCLAFYTTEMPKAVKELKDLGMDPSKSTFVIALLAKIAVSKTGWNERVAEFKKWGWSDEVILNAFRKSPHCMRASIDKINLVMSFWVNQLGWDALALVKAPRVFSVSLERIVIPRAAVVQFLLKKGLRKKNASLTSPFIVSEKLFLENFILCFVEDSSDLLKLYEEKLKLVTGRTLACSSPNT